MKFKEWLINNYLQEHLVEMATIISGKYAGKDHTQLDSWYRNAILEFWKWLKDGADPATKPQYDYRRIIDSLIDQGVKYEDLVKQAGKGAVKPQIQTTQQQVAVKPNTAVQSGNIWIHANVVQDVNAGRDKFVQGDEVALQKRQDGNYDLVSLKDPKIKSILQAANVANFVQSMKDAQGKPVQKPLADLVQDYKDKHPEGSADEEETGNGLKTFSSFSKRPSPEQVKIKPEHMTEYNKAIEQKFLQSNQSMVIEASAGSGKTTMLKHLASFIKPGEKILYLVFNKKNQLESQDAFPAGVDVMTTHSFLGKLLQKSGKAAGGQTTLPPKDAKWKKINLVLDKMIAPAWPKSSKNYTNRKTGAEQSPFHFGAKRTIYKMASLAKNTAHNPNDPNIKNQLHQMIKEFGIDTDLSTEKYDQDRDYTPDLIDKTIELMKYTMPNALPKNIGLQEVADVRDQDDTLWFAAVHADEINWKTGYNLILLDEIQDLNKCQLIMAKKLKEAGSRIVGCGDKNQSMYLFRGSSAKAFDELKDIIGDPHPSDLPINFRSGGNIVDWVVNNTHVKKLQAAPHLKGKGEVYANGGTKPPIGYEDFMNLVKGEWDQTQATGKPNLTEGTCIISRTNAPLAHAALQLLKNNINFEIVGKDLSKELVDHINTITWHKPQGLPIDELPNKLGEYFQQVQDKWGHKISKQDELKKIEEYTETLTSVWQYLAEKEYKETLNSPSMENTKDFINFIVKKMSGKDEGSEKDMRELKAKDPRSFVTLTTAHKCKGLQWKRTFILKPSQFNPENEKNVTEDQKEQERNAFYVSTTRAENSLYISSDDLP